MILSNDMQGLRNTCAWSIFRKGGRRVEAEAMISSDIKEPSKTPVVQGSSGESVSMWGVEVVWSKLAGLGMGGVRVSRRPGIRRAASRRRTFQFPLPPAKSLIVEQLRPTRKLVEVTYLPEQELKDGCERLDIVNHIRTSIPCM